LAITIVVTPSYIRVIRSAVLPVKENEYIIAAQTVGATSLRIVAKHVLPNILAPVLILVSTIFGLAILIEGALSFLGLGTPPPTPSWGNMLGGDARIYLESVPTLSIFPGLAITLSVLAFNLLGDAIRDVFDPRLRGVN
jgi:ABC-type dipeptide/oligopeptide/nickel transport system permease subunit